MTFGEKLRGYRIGAGKSLNVLARESNCSKSYLSRLESGQRRPSPEVARHLDTLLDAGGALEAAAGDDRRRSANPVAVPDPGVDEAAYRDALLRLRELGRRHPARMVLSMVRGTVVDLGDARVAAHLTEYASWMAQETGDTAEALRLIRSTADLARRAGARDLQAYAQVRRAELLLSDPRRSAELAAGIRDRRGVASRIRGLAALTEAKALAQTGSARAVEAALDAGATLLSRPGADGPFPVGPSTVADEVAAVGGWTMFDLGRATAAVTRLGAAIDGSPPDGHRARGLLGARLARAHLDLGDLEEAGAAARASLAMARRSGSASTLAELRLFGQDLRRWPGDPVAAGLRAEVAAGLTLTGTV
ncbi:helix-turn-helix domain-containing protein [Herbidospora cretacea]|uniref:helix-turn-helix domain-containing protein n=1 Tax=Herbidospora cretacea TaxID=28444 RepID=UPI000557BB4E|nr:helix-turn-helix transcriptional regulator [Herbidospora cretacea]